jgi:hypothetical protein
MDLMIGCACFMKPLIYQALMGGNVSKDMSVTDISTEFVTDVVTKAMSTKTTNVTSNQTMTIGCSDEVFKKVVDACSQAQAAQATALGAASAAAITSGKDIPDSVSKLLSTKPAICEACSVSDVNQSSIITISMSDVQDNSLASKIQNDLLSKLDAAKSTLQNEGFSKNDVLDNSMTTISNKIKSSMTTEVINNTLSTFTNTQNLTIGNTMQASHVNQSSVINYVSSALVQNVVEGDSAMKAAIDNITKKDTTQKSIASNAGDMIGGVANNLIGSTAGVLNKGLGTLGSLGSTWIIMIVVGFIALAWLATRFLSSPAGQQLASQAMGMAGGPMSMASRMMGAPMGYPQQPPMGYPQQPPMGYPQQPQQIRMNFTPDQAMAFGNQMTAAANMANQIQSLPSRQRMQNAMRQVGRNAIMSRANQVVSL